MGDDENSHDRQLASDLRRVGGLPRALSLGLVAVSFVVAWLSGLSVPSTVAQAVIVAGPLVVFLLSLRIHARIVSDRLVVRSYLATYEVDFEDVLAFVDTDYSGFWNRFSDGDGWLNFKLRMLGIEMLGERGLYLPATMTTRSVNTRIVEGLNRRVPESMPDTDANSF